ncbi:hypothetical protein [Streptomyces atroolivaceus]|uniref:Translation initiation factor IF-2 n=1 Tax=Streptomyces atroolivaceus TaxID=66869 RepID=A0ABV9VHE1_STRAZ|nr:hypothetical protein [Streptomyces atroolivaceus]
MQSDPVIEKAPAPRGRRRAHAGPARSAERRRSAGQPQEGPVFVDSSGRRARLLRRAGMLLGTVCVGYAAVLGLAFMGGVSLTPSQLLPFDGAPAAEAGPGGRTQPGYGPPPGGTAPPSGAPTPPSPSGGATPSGPAAASDSASASDSGGAN